VIIFAADDPLVLNGTYDREGYKPGERERIANARARQEKEATMGRTKKADRLQNERRAARATKPDKPKRGRPPKQQDLIEDRAIKPLEDIAESYADCRDRRMELTKEEKELKEHAVTLMHKFGKTIYRHNGVEIRLVPGEEDVKVKVRKPGDEEEAEDGDELEVSGAGEAAEV
jgi:hypothetical protein